MHVPCHGMENAWITVGGSKQKMKKQTDIKATAIAVAHRTASTAYATAGELQR